ncbi:MAG: aspartate--ammonia ligase [Candidatus Aminicenantes bacterium]|nr:aspartate--ammonia ligase [Candidatus Aminicenantes bacterium]
MTDKWIFPDNYRPLLTPFETENAIKKLRDFFQLQLSVALNLRRITAPLLLKSGTGINDDLNGSERPISFDIKNGNGIKVELVQSLAKWKRLALAELNLKKGEGIYTDMNAIRPDEKLDNLHSVYVDQWDWEMVIDGEQRNLNFLKTTVRTIYRVIRETEIYMHHQFPVLTPNLPEEITFIQAEELALKYPQLTPKEREDAICSEAGAVFIIGIGAPLSDGFPHDGRAPDYDDWITPNGEGTGLNGDILVWYPLLNQSLELSSMGIRVNPAALEHQLELSRTTDRRSLFFHRCLLSGRLPLSIGGGIGQSRLCLFILRKAHIGEVQAGIWPEEILELCRRCSIHLF